MTPGRTLRALFVLVGIGIAAGLGAPDVDARGGGGRGGGRGGFSRGGSARGGGFRPPPSMSRPASRPSTRPSQRPDFSGRPTGRPGASGERPTFEEGRRYERPSTGQRPATRDRAARPAQGLAGTAEQRPARPNRPDPGQAGQKWQDYKNANREDWQGFLDQRQQDRQDSMNQRQEDRQEFAEDVDWSEYDCWESDELDFFWGASFGFVVGMAFTSAAMDSMSCTMEPVSVDFVQYYRCGPTWYSRAMSGGQVTYVVVNPPPGY